MVTKESIINWLKANGIYKQVQDNVEECTRVKLGTVYTLEKILDVSFKAKLEVRNFLQMAFDWRMANESYSYWEEKNKAFQEWFDSQKHRVSTNTVLGAFMDFLDKHDAREQFEYNRKNDSTYKLWGIVPDATIEAYVNRVCGNSTVLDPERLLSCAFKWNFTPEGNDFWNKLDEEWIEIYSKL